MVTGGIQACKILHFEFARVELRLVGVGCEEGAVGELAALPENASAPDFRVAQHQRQRLAHDLVLTQRSVSYASARKHFGRVHDLGKRNGSGYFLSSIHSRRNSGLSKWNKSCSWRFG